MDGTGETGEGVEHEGPTVKQLPKAIEDSITDYAAGVAAEHHHEIVQGLKDAANLLDAGVFVRELIAKVARNSYRDALTDVSRAHIREPKVFRAHTKGSP